jgi:protein-S-isoprenylcysteine O-methyltransferase Ste14
MTAANATRAGSAGAVHDAGATRDDASRLPALGHKGGGWVAIQAALLVAAVAAGLAGAAWPHAAGPWLAAAGAIVALAGAGLMIGAGAGLGKQLTPFPRPVDDGSLREDGVFGLVRHPMYGGAMLLILGWTLLSSPVALIPLAVAAVFLDAKRRREEAWLSEEYAGYADYRRKVRRQFIPFVW